MIGSFASGATEMGVWRVSHARRESGKFDSLGANDNLYKFVQIGREFVQIGREFVQIVQKWSFLGPWRAKILKLSAYGQSQNSHVWLFPPEI